MSETNETKPRQTPQPVLNAQAALAQLRAQDAELAARIATLLPGYAVRMDQRGEDTSVEALIAAAQRGPAALKEVFAQAAAPLTLPERYAKWIADTRKSEQLPQSHAHPNGDLNGYNTFTDEFAMRAMFPATGLYTHAMVTSHAGGMTRYRDFQERSYKMMSEPDAHKQLEMARALVTNAEPRLALHFFDCLARMRKFELLANLLPAASHLFDEEHGLVSFKQSIMLYAALHTLPHSEPFLMQLLRMNQSQDTITVQHLILRIATATGLSEAATNEILDMQAPSMQDGNWLEIATRVTANDTLVRKAISRLGPDCSRTISAQEIHKAAQSFTAIRSPQTLDEVFKHPVFSEISWAEMLYKNAADMSPEAIQLITKGLAPGWEQQIDLDRLKTSFLNIDSARAFLACLSPGYIQANIQVLVRRGAEQNNHPDKTAGGPFLQALAELPAFAQLPVFETLSRQSCYEHQTQSMIRLLNCMSHEQLKQLSEEQRGALMRMNKYNYGIAVPLALSGPCTQDDKNKALQSAAEHIEGDDTAVHAAYLLVKYGADVSALPQETRPQIAEQHKALDHWQRLTRNLPPNGLLQYDPAPFKAPLFADIVAIMKTEKYTGAAAHHYAYRATALFQSGERVLQYLQKWGDANSRQPLHNLLQKIEIPRGDLRNVNLNDWGDAALRHGPQMAKLVKFCKDIPSPARSDDGASWSLTKTREIAAQYVYARGSEHRALAALCHKHSVTERSFNTALDIIARTPVHQKNLPALDIAGKDFDMPNAHFRLLDSSDIRGLFLGELTDCCQSIGAAGDKCATHGFTSPNGGFYVIETDKGEIIGQTWAWRGEEGELVFDSLEMLKGRVSPQQWYELMTQVVKHISDRKAQHGITAFMLGTSGETPSSFASIYPRAAGEQPYLSHAMRAAGTPQPEKPKRQQEPAKPRDYAGYRDSKEQYIIWQKPETKAPARATKPK